MIRNEQVKEARTDCDAWRHVPSINALRKYELNLAWVYHPSTTMGGVGERRKDSPKPKKSDTARKKSFGRWAGLAIVHLLRT